jgi:hypothetical protein
MLLAMHRFFFLRAMARSDSKGSLNDGECYVELLIPFGGAFVSSFLNRPVVLLGLLLALFISGCSGNGSAALSSSRVPAISASPASDNAPQVSLGISIPVSSAGSSSTKSLRAPKHIPKVHPAFVSSSSASLSITVNTLDPVYEDLSENNPDCKKNLGELDCKLSFTVPYGEDTLSFALFDQGGGAGNLLATSVASVDVTKLEQSLTINMHGVERSISVTPASAYVPLVRSTSSPPTFVKLTVAASDADGNEITDDTSDIITYDSPITLTDRDQSGPATGLVVVKSGATPTVPSSVQKSVSITDPSQDVYAIYYGGFIRAVAFDASSPDVTNASNVTPGGFSTDCEGNFAVAESLPGATQSLVKPRFARLVPNAQQPLEKRSATRRGAVSPVFAGGGSAVYYDSNYLTGCSYDGTDYDCGIETLTPGECISMGMGFDDGSVPNDNETLTWTWNGASNLTSTITPQTTTNGVPTCYELYVPPTGTIGSGDIWQPDVGVPWVAGTILNNPVVDVGEGVGAATAIPASTYYDDLEDCVAGTHFPEV